MWAAGVWGPGGWVWGLRLRARSMARRTGGRAESMGACDRAPPKRRRAYAKGNRQKGALIAELSAGTKLLILDKPTSGLDPLMAQQFQLCAREAAQRGSSVLLSSHILSEVEELCESVTIIRAGKTVRTGTLEELRHLRRSRVRTTVVGGGEEQLSAIAGVHDFSATHTPGGVEVSFTVAQDDLGVVTRSLGALTVSRLLVEPPSLEELFLHAYDSCPLYTSDAADERSSVDLGGRRIIQKKKQKNRQT